MKCEIIEDKEQLYDKCENMEQLYDNYYYNLLVNYQELKKQLENANEQVDYLRRSIERQESTIIDLEQERVPYTNEYVEELKEELEERENQQKEFIEYLENEKDRLIHETSHYYIDSFDRQQAVNKTIYDEVDTILSKYKERIGGKE